MKNNKITLLMSFGLFLSIFTSYSMQKRSIKDEWQAEHYKTIEIKTPRATFCNGCDKNVLRKSGEFFGMDSTDKYIIFKSSSLCSLCWDSALIKPDYITKFAYDPALKKMKDIQLDQDIRVSQGKYAVKFCEAQSNGVMPVVIRSGKDRYVKMIQNESVIPVIGIYLLGSKRRDDNNITFIQTQKKDESDFQEYITLCDPIAFCYPNLKDDRYLAFLKKTRAHESKKTIIETVFVNDDGTMVCVYDRVDNVLTIFKLYDQKPGLNISLKAYDAFGDLVFKLKN